MGDVLQIIDVLGRIVVVVPVLLVATLGLPTLLDRPWGERATSRIVQIAMITGLLAGLAVIGLMLVSGTRHVTVSFGNLVEIPAHGDAGSIHTGSESGLAGPHFHFALKFVFDRLSVPFVTLTYLLCGTISAFASRYLHREPGYNRFFILYALFAMGMVVTSLAETIETLFTGWEFVGISSALLVAFFHERQNPVRNGLRVWSVYRLSDAALLLAAVALHHLSGEGDFAAALGGGPWPQGRAVLSSSQALIVGLLLLVAAAGKSALIPFCGWLPRAMEGPTPSSAIFYGSLSVHLGAFLLLRISPLFELSPVLSAATVLLGLCTALLAALAGRVQTDIKSALAFAALTQVGLIVAEIGFGLRYLALVHILGHASLRTLQFLRASSLLADYLGLENAVGERLPAESAVAARLSPRASGAWLYRLALERGYLDSWLNEYVARPVLGVLKWCDARERKAAEAAIGEQQATISLAPLASRWEESA